MKQQSNYWIEEGIAADSQIIKICESAETYTMKQLSNSAQLPA